MIRVVPFCPLWAEKFSHEKILIEKVWSRHHVTATCYHVGSTSVPGLAAKPVIDMMVSLPINFNTFSFWPDIIIHMDALGYVKKEHTGIPFHVYFHRSDAHVHCFEAGNPEIARTQYMRDWLVENSEDRQAYADLKYDLASRYAHDFQAYCAGKDIFVKSLDCKGRFKDYRMVEVISARERDIYHAHIPSVKEGSPVILYHGGHLVACASVDTQKGWIHAFSSLEKIHIYPFLRYLHRWLITRAHDTVYTHLDWLLDYGYESSCDPLYHQPCYARILTKDDDLFPWSHSLMHGKHP